MSNYRIISSDDHVFEPPGLWTDRIEAEFRDRAPRVVRQEDGGGWWVCDGITVMGSGGGTQPGRRFEDSEKLSMRDTLENVRPGGWDPYEHVKDMDTDGVDVSISSGRHHQDSGEAKIRESTAGVSRKPSSDCKACGCSSKHLCGLTAWNT